MDWKKTLKKVWFFIWEDDSVWSWIVNVILAFIIIKFLIFPGLGWALGSPAPIVAVVSGSMEHDSNFDQWWEDESCCDPGCSQSKIQSVYYKELKISKQQFRSFPFVNGFNKGDIMVLLGPENAEAGDVIVYNVKHRSDPIIHRVVSVSKKNDKLVYNTKGDHNCGIADFEFNIPKERVIGKAVWRVPFLGWVKIIFVELLSMVTR